MGKIAVIGLVWLVLFAFALILIDNQLSLGNIGQTSIKSEGDGGDKGTSSATGPVILRVDAYLKQAKWGRGSNDLPTLELLFNYTVENIGEATAADVTAEIDLGSAGRLTREIGSLPPKSKFDDSFSFSVQYDTQETCGVTASSYDSAHSWDFNVDAELPRLPSWEDSKLFITPQDRYVETVYNEIMSGLNFFMPFHWVAIRDWVGKNIDYIDDVDNQNVSEFWQLSRETLDSSRGDCEDLAILLCSLLRADGWSAEKVYVVLGENEAGEHHAWVKIEIMDGIWYNIEPQRDGWSTLLIDYLVLNGYTALYSFNDKYFVLL